MAKFNFYLGASASSWLLAILVISAELIVPFKNLHKHTRHCFWRDDNTFDKHGITCSVCFNIAIETKKMHEEGKDICEIRKAIDKFYEPNKHLGTDTPMPEGCTEG